MSEINHFNGHKEAQEAQDGVIVLCFLCLFVAIKNKPALQNSGEPNL
jgi:hypothetical protein